MAPLPPKPGCPSHDDLIRRMTALEDRQDKIGTDNALILSRLGDAGDLSRPPSGMTAILLALQAKVGDLSRDRIKLDSLVDAAEEEADTQIRSKVARVAELEAALAKVKADRDAERDQREAAWKRTVATVLIALATGAGGGGLVRDTVAFLLNHNTTTVTK